MALIVATFVYMYLKPDYDIKVLNEYYKQFQVGIEENNCAMATKAYESIHTEDPENTFTLKYLQTYDMQPQALTYDVLQNYIQACKTNKITPQMKKNLNKAIDYSFNSVPASL
jgi:hypothetical protein